MPVARNTWQPSLTLNPASARAPADHAVGIDAVHRLVGQHAGLADRGAEEGGLGVLPDGSEIFIDELLELVMRRHLVALGAFFVQPQPPALAAGVVVLDRVPGATTLWWRPSSSALAQEAWKTQNI
jgi:hypothetical protein